MHEASPHTWAPDLVERLRRSLDAVHIKNPSREGDRRAAVCLTLVRPSSPRILAVARTIHGVHGGQIGLPGGKTEEGDHTTWDTARRELVEEIGFEGDLIHLGHLGEFNTHGSRFRVDVEVACAIPTAAWRLQEEEVTGLLELPLADLLPTWRAMPTVDDVWHLPIECGFDIAAKGWLVAGKSPQRGRGQQLIHGDAVREMPFIWGLTARILYAFFGQVWMPSGS